ncbi:amino acid adenylation domain-containing protein [Salinivibrio kushneri]|uniref:Amino acid adenylation domain-containing protein n=1 Tax=Salinivibrio kushneri TaxID=1908198 RepID=A0AA47KNM3_9GAMM|nr:amino acid adenylation domain-containing protein [Salinivibrio kushneri]WBA10280.1 amino acid adenylation domain-containing protein [Salinivibrio kushneri]
MLASNPRSEQTTCLAAMLKAALTEAAASDGVAIDFGEQSIRYDQLLVAVSQVQQRLNQAGLRPGDRVGVHVMRSPTLITTLLACLFSGVAFVPLDPLFPSGRLKEIADEAKLNAVIEASCDGSAPIAFDCPVVTLRLVDENTAKETSRTPLHLPLLSPQSTAYIMFTSGSTGKPKGVVISHQAMATFLSAAVTRLNLDSECHWLLITTIAFDISMLEIFAPLLVGGRLCLASSEEHKDPHLVAALLTRHPSINTLQATPTFWRMMVNIGWRGKAGLRALIGGEALDAGLAEQLMARSRILWNCYGPTEATVWSMMSEVTTAHRLTIGSSLAGYGHFVLDEEGQPVPFGHEGELCICGNALSDGYWQRDDLTASQFITCSDGRRYYRTGDIVRQLADDCYHYIGRQDGQVKLRGYRIELGEIEARLRGLEAVLDAVVKLEGEGENRVLVGYLEQGERSNASTPKMTRLQLRKALAPQLPGYMIPTRFIWLESLPKTASGKVDRKQLMVS